MRKMYVVILIVLLLSGCSKFNQEMGEILVESSTVTVSQTEIKAAEDEGVTSAKSTTIPDRDDNIARIPESSEIRDEESKTETTGKEALPPQSLSSDNSVVSNDSDVSDVSRSITIPQEVETTTVPTSARAGKEDATEVANRVLYYINEFRDVPATYLPDLAEYARHRSRQLISNFAHDTADQRTAATTLQYGE